KKASVTVVTGSSVATVLLYLIAPAFITLSGWKSLFFFSALCGLMITLAWLPSIRKIQKQADGLAEESQTTNTFSQEAPKEFTKPVVACLFVIMFAIILQGFLRDGVTTWMPSFISETYNTSSSTAILSSVILPLFSVACFHIVSFINMKLIKNELLCASIFFAVAAVSSTVLAFNINTGIAVAIGLNTLITGCMHGINLVLNTYVPVFFRKYGRVSLISGVLNACTYVGTAIASPVIAITSEAYGWNVTVLTWSAVALCGVIACGALVKPWKTIK
ncbi:MAG: MFS transporter, partial [Clostridia bacterium]|nr:MFS transporter [Clostridia bacterium]